MDNQLEDFKAGQYVWVGGRSNVFKVVKVGGDSPQEYKEYSGDYKEYSGDATDYEEYGPQYIWVYNEVNEVWDGWRPDSILTSEQMEEQMHHCGTCGKEGHNTRTCPELIKDPEYGWVQVDMSEIKAGNTIKILGSPGNEKKDNFNTYFGKEYEVREINSQGPLTPVGRFMKDQNWQFALYKEIHDEEKSSEKKLTIWELTETVIPISRLILLYGPPGTGKTTVANRNVKSGLEVSNITLTEETPAAELRGHFIPKGQEFIWMDGPAMTRFTYGGRLVLNEIDKASGDALTFCHALLDDPEIARITLPTGDTRMPHEDFSVVATMNGEPEDLPDALRDRFAIRLHIDKLHPEAAKTLPKDLQKIAKKGISGDQGRSVSVRGWKAFANLREVVGESSAALAVFGERAETILNTLKIDRSGSDSKKAKRH